MRPESRTLKETPSSYLRIMYFNSSVYEPEALTHLVSRVGVDRVMRRSDFPFDMGPEDPVGHVRATPGLDEDEKAAICGGNAAGLLGLLPAEADAATPRNLSRRRLLCAQPTPG